MNDIHFHWLHLVRTKVFFSNHYRNFEHKFKTMLIWSWSWPYTNLEFHPGELYKMIHLGNNLSSSGWVRTLKNATTNCNHTGSLMRHDSLLKWDLANIGKEVNSRQWENAIIYPCISDNGLLALFLSGPIYVSPQLYFWQMTWKMMSVLCALTLRSQGQSKNGGPTSIV